MFGVMAIFLQKGNILDIKIKIIDAVKTAIDYDIFDGIFFNFRIATKKIIGENILA